MLEFERTCPAPHARIYYELLCDDPKGTVRQLMEFLELEPDDGQVERALQTDHGRGPGDYKIDFTGSISADSIESGVDAAQTLLPAQVARINELLAELDYPTLEDAWRATLPTCSV